MKYIKFILGFIVVIIIIAIILVAMQKSGTINVDFVQDIQDQGLWTWFKQLWLDNITPLWNEYVKPLLS